MIQTTGRVYEAVKELLQARGFDTNTLEIGTFGRSTHHDIFLNGQHIGSYEHRGKTLALLERDSKK